MPDLVVLGLDFELESRGSNSAPLLHRRIPEPVACRRRLEDGALSLSRPDPLLDRRISLVDEELVVEECCFRCCCVGVKDFRDDEDLE